MECSVCSTLLSIIIPILSPCNEFYPTSTLLWTKKTQIGFHYSIWIDHWIPFDLQLEKANKPIHTGTFQTRPNFDKESLHCLDTSMNISNTEFFKLDLGTEMAIYIAALSPSSFLKHPSLLFNLKKLIFTILFRLFNLFKIHKVHLDPQGIFPLIDYIFFPLCVVSSKRCIVFQKHKPQFRWIK